MGAGQTSVKQYNRQLRNLIHHDKLNPGLIAVPTAFVAALVTSALLVVAFLDNPYGDWPGSLQPDQMRVTLTLIDNGHVVEPCNANGDHT